MAYAPTKKQPPRQGGQILALSLLVGLAALRNTIANKEKQFVAPSRSSVYRSSLRGLPRKPTALKESVQGFDVGVDLSSLRDEVIASVGLNKMIKKTVLKFLGGGAIIGGLVALSLALFSAVGQLASVSQKTYAWSQTNAMATVTSTSTATASATAFGSAGASTAESTAVASYTATATVTASANAGVVAVGRAARNTPVWAGIVLTTMAAMGGASAQNNKDAGWFYGKTAPTAYYIDPPPPKPAHLAPIKDYLKKVGLWKDDDEDDEDAQRDQTRSKGI